VTRADGPGGASFAPGAGGTTGRFLVLFAEARLDEGVRALASGAGVAATRPEREGLLDFGTQALEDTGSLAIDELGVAVVSAEPDQYQPMSDTADASPSIMAVVPERWLFPIEAVGGPQAPDEVPSMPFRDTEDGTWGLHAAGVIGSKLTGRGVRVAVLDTGCDLQHPDFAGRVAASQSFVPTEPVQDTHGHGTHCCGTVAGPLNSGGETRYGVAPDSALHVGKVMGAGGGGEGLLLQGIAWALANGCRVVSMSLGAPTLPNEAFNPVVEEAARRATEQGALLVAAAGNDSDRSRGVIKPVSRPANTPSMMAVAALDASLQIGGFSNAGLSPQGQVDIAGPGVRIYSSWPQPAKYRAISGTSMAAPHVAGVAALLAEANPDARGADLWTMLSRGARRLPLASSDVGVGLVYGA
jgi:subtilisin family serine protease